MRARALTGIVLGTLLVGACTSHSAPSATRIDLDARYCSAQDRLNDLLLLELGPTYRTSEETAELLGPLADEFKSLAGEYGDLELETASRSMGDIAEGIEEYRTAITNSTVGDEGFAGHKIFSGLRQAGIPCPAGGASPSSPTSTGSPLTFSGDLQLVVAVPRGVAAEDVMRATQVIKRRLSALGAAQSTVTRGVGLIGVYVTELQAGPLVEQNGRYCVTTNEGADLGCFATRTDAVDTAKERMVDRLVHGVETTGWMEEREVLEAIDPSSQTYEVAVLTPRDVVSGRFSAPGSTSVIAFADSNDDGHFTDGVDVKYRLGPAEITDADLVEVKADFQGETATSVGAGWLVDITLNAVGTERFAEATSRLIGKQLAILVDGIVLTAPTVQAAITGGEVQISGGFTERTARDLALVLSLGSLPFVVERRTLDVHLAQSVP